MVRATGGDRTRARGEDVLPPELRDQILRSIAEKQAATEAALDDAKLREKALRGGA